MKAKRLLVLCVSLLAFDACSGAKPDPNAVTQENLLDNDRFWPYQVRLSRDWISGDVSLPAGSSGVVIRVEDVRTVRVDFGRDGLYSLPIDRTDLVAQANRVRRGELVKLMPNLILAIGPRLLDPATARPFRPGEPIRERLVLCLFADTNAAGFEEIGRALSPLLDEPDLLTVLLPQGEHPDLALAARLEALAWPVPFLQDHLAEPYTRTLIDPDVGFPVVTLQTNEGRLLYSGTWSAETPNAIRSALTETNS